MRPVPHSENLLGPIFPANKDLIPSSYKEMASRDDSTKSISSEDNVSVYSGVRSNEPPLYHARRPQCPCL